MLMRCRKCLTEKEASAFYTSNKTRCRECVSASAIAHRQANLESVRAYDRLRNSQPHRIAARKEYRRTPAGREAHRREIKVGLLRFPEKARARNALSSAVHEGKVKPWPVCAVPECNKKPEAHHPDYSAPLAVVWLCHSHHREAHAITLELETP